MTTKRKRYSLALICACLIGLLSFVGSYWFISYHTERLVYQTLLHRQENVIKQGEQSGRFLQNQFYNLVNIVNDFCSDEELIRFVTDGNEKSWFEQSIMPFLMKGENQSIDVLLVYDGQRINAVHGKLDGFDDSKILLSNPLIKKSFLGELQREFLLSDGSLYAVVAAPISPGYEGAEVSGVLLVGRKIGNRDLVWHSEFVEGEVTLVVDGGSYYSSKQSSDAFVPPLFSESIALAQRGKVVSFGRNFGVPFVVRDYLRRSIAVLWTVLDKDSVPSLKLNMLNSSERIWFAVLISFLVSLCSYFLVFWFVRKPIRNVLLQKDRTPENQFETLILSDFIDEVLSVKKAIGRLQKAVVQGREIRKTILHNIHGGFALIDLKGEILEVNPALCSIVDSSSERFLKETNPFFFLDEEGQSLAEEFVVLVRSGQTQIKRGFECKLAWSDTERNGVRVRLYAVPDEFSKECHICMFVDSPDAHPEIDFDIQELGNMRVLVKFAGSIAHNMNNIFTGILSAVSLFEKGKLQPADQQKMYSSIRDAIKRGTELCNELLQMSKVRQVRSTRRPINVQPIIADVIRMSSELHEARDCQFVIVANETPRLALCDESGLHQILLNLVLNSLDALQEIPEPRIEVRLDQELDGSNVVIHVSDNGAGMSQDVQKMIFSPFFTTKSAVRERKKTFGGSGLGLPSSLETIESWGGTLTCTSKEGVGTTFSITLQSAGQHALANEQA